MILYGAPVIAAYAALFVANGIWNTWETAYDVSVVITSPRDPKVDLDWLAWPLSVAGWLIAPVAAGAMVGYTVNTSLARRRGPDDDRSEARRPTEGRAPRRGKGRNPGRSFKMARIPSLRDRAATREFGITNEFVDYFLAIHEYEWEVAEDHFELEVSDNLNRRDVAKPRDPQGVAIRLAVTASVSLLMKTRRELNENLSQDNPNSKGRCHHCPQDESSASGE